MMEGTSELLDQFGSLACRAIWETLEGFDFNLLIPTEAQLEETKRETIMEENNKTDLDLKEKLPVIKLRFKKQFHVRNKIAKRAAYPIVLREEQLEHRERLSEILNKNAFAFDFSMMGTGKTYVASSLYQNEGFEHLICIVPSSVKTKWQYMYQNHGLDLDFLVSYSELRSKRFHQPNHGLLVRREKTKTIRGRDGNNRRVEVTTFEPTDLYLNRVKNGVILIIDEIQNIKNINDQLSACRALVAPILARYEEEKKIIKTDGRLPSNFRRSRVLLLSGSPMDKRSQVIHFYRCLGIMKSDKLRVYNPFLGITNDQGISEIKSYYQKTFPHQYRTYCFNYQYGDYWCHSDQLVSELENRCYSLFQKILKPEVSSSMDPITSNYQLRLYNGFFKMEPSDLNLLSMGIETLEKATNYNPQLHTVNFGHDGVATLRNIQRALIMIETSKVNLMVRLARERLDADPNQKVVLAVNYTETVVDLMEALKAYHPLRLTGEVTNKKRYEILERFQEASTDSRLIIGNLTVLSTGIDLDDTNGSFPRVAYVNPNYSAISLYQFGYRFHRAYTRSDSEVYFVFGRDEKKLIDEQKSELPIIDSLSKKGEILAETCDNQRESGVKFPGTYSPYIEF